MLNDIYVRWTGVDINNLLYLITNIPPLTAGQTDLNIGKPE
ncbi:hypothetical protein [uncultured Nostoc sp.]